jgi:excisionase family DNA binding protein
MATKRAMALTEVLEWPGVAETARRLGISLNRTYALIWTGKLPAQQIAGQWRISPEAIEQRLARKAQQ